MSSVLQLNDRIQCSAMTRVSVAVTMPSTVDQILLVNGMFFRYCTMIGPLVLSHGVLAGRSSADWLLCGRGVNGARDRENENDQCCGDWQTIHRGACGF